MPHIESLPLPADAELCEVARPVPSVARRERWAAFALLASVSLTVAGAFAAAGAWPIVPYAVLELGLLAAAFWWIERRGADCERIAVVGDRVIVERTARGRTSRREFDRWRLRVQLERSGAARAEQLTLRCAGESVHFGDALPRERRIELARRLRRLTALD